MPMVPIADMEVWPNGSTVVPTDSCPLIGLSDEEFDRLERNAGERIPWRGGPLCKDHSGTCPFFYMADAGIGRGARSLINCKY